MSDILTRLLLNTGDYDTKLAKAKKSSGDFASEIGGKVAGMVGKFAAGIGVAMGGVEAFKKMMDSTQSSGDLMRGTMQSLKTSVDEFFYSVNKGNLSLFIQNLSDIASKAKEAYVAMDQLGNTQISYGVLGAKNSAAIAEAQYLAKNKFAPLSVRENAFADWKNAILSEGGNIEALQRELVNAATSAVEARTNANLEITLDDLVKAFETDLKDPTSRALAKSRAEMGMRNYEANAKRTDWTQEQKDALAELQRENIITYTMLEKYSDEELQSIAKQIQQYYGLINAVKNLGREYNETANEFNNANKKAKGFNPIESLSGYTVYSGSSEAGGKFETQRPIEGSLAAIDAEIKKAQQEYANAASDAARKAALKTIRTLEEKKTTIEFNVKYNEPKYSIGNTKLGKVSSMPVSLEKINIPIQEKDVETAETFAERLNSVASAIGAINGATTEGAAAWLSWAASVMTASAQAVDSISRVVAAKTAEGAASAGASAASTPVVGWMMIGGAIAAALAAFASIPKFADGGIIGGSSYFGDKLLARVNSGEMILNQGQQARLLNMTEGGNVRVTGDVRLNGKDIYISLRNYMSASGNRL